MAEIIAPAAQLDTTLTADPWRRAAEIRPQGIGFTALVYQWVRVGESVYQAPIVDWRGQGSVTPAQGRAIAAAILAACDLAEAWALDTGKAPGAEGSA